MAAVPGTGGYINIGTGVGAVRVNVSEWSLDGGNRVVDGTTSLHTAANYEGTINDPSVSLTLLADDTNFPEASGLTEGSKISISLKLGTLNKWHTITGAVVERVNTVTKSDGDIIRMQISTKGGVLARNANASL